VAGTNPDFEGFARLHGVDPALGQYASMKEGIAGTIGEFDESEALVRVEPFNDTVNRGTGRCLEGRSAEPGWGFESAGLWVVDVSVEVATPRMTKILVSQLGSWWVRALSAG
jgi:hypothetical protein